MFNIKVPLPSVKTAFDLLIAQIARLDWFKNNNRLYRLEYYQKLNNPIINEMIENRNMEKSAFYSKYRKLFADKLYEKELYADRISQVKEAVLKLQPCYEKFEDLKKSWGFELLPEYHVDINLYGVGGSYYRDDKGCGHVVIGFGRRYSLDWLARTIGHEMIHLGIEDLIINPKHRKEALIKQEEKERIVDNLCIYVMDGVLPLERTWENGKKSNYQEIALCADYMDKIVGKQPENNVILSVEQFLKKNGRI